MLISSEISHMFVKTDLTSASVYVAIAINAQMHRLISCHNVRMCDISQRLLVEGERLRSAKLVRILVCLCTVTFESHLNT